jgi:hypothetical protein
MIDLLSHVWHLLISFAACAVVVGWLRLLIDQYDRTKEKVFLYGAIFSLMLFEHFLKHSAYRSW